MRSLKDLRPQPSRPRMGIKVNDKECDMLVKAMNGFRVFRP